jgi:rhodanese-related sulfurtransferase
VVTVLSLNTHGEISCSERAKLISNKKEKSTVLTISRDELKKKIDRGDKFLLVETLSETAYHHAHLPGALNLPPDKVTLLAPTLLPDKNAEIVVYCASPT